MPVKNDRFAEDWPANETFFHAIRGKDGLIDIAIDPLTSYECVSVRRVASILTSAGSQVCAISPEGCVDPH